MPQISAVLTGDLIKSTQSNAPRVDLVMRAIEAVGSSTDREASFQRFRGDGWQMHLPAGGKALHVLLRIVSTLRSEDGPRSRISIALGTDTTGRVEDIASSQAEAFRLSGQGLDRMSKHETITFGLAPSLRDEPLSHAECLAQSLIKLLEFQFGRWSREQAEAVRLMLETVPYRTHVEIAEILGITRQAAAARLKGAGASAASSAAWAFFQTFQGGEWQE